MTPLRFLPSLAILLWATTTAAAAPAAPAPLSLSAAELRALAAGDTSEAPAVILLESGTFRFDDAGRCSYRLHRIVHIRSEEAVESWGSVTKAWAPWHQHEATLRARVLDPAGRFRELEPGALAGSSRPSAAAHTFSDWRSRSAELPGAAPGAIVETVLEVVDREPLFAAGTVHEFSFVAEVPVARTVLVVDRPAGLALGRRARLLPDLEVRSERRGDRRRWIFEHGPLPAWRIPEALPGDEPRYPMIALTTGRSWAAVATALAERFEERIAAGPPPAEALPAPGASPRDTARAALALLRERVGTTEVPFGDSSIEPWSPAETWFRRYGDSADTAALLVAMLRGAGLEAHVALVDSGGDADVDPALPGLGSFDRALVHVPALDPPFVDPDASLARLGQLPGTVQGRRALLVRPGQSELVRVPRAAADDVYNLEERVLHMADYGVARAHETARYGGAWELRMRRYYGGASPEEREEHLRGYVEGQYGGALVRSEVGDPAALDQPLVSTLHIERASVADVGTHSGGAVFSTWDLTANLPEVIRGDRDAPPRRQPVLIEPHVARHRFRVVPPAGFEVTRLPTVRHHVAGPLSIRRDVSRDGRDVIIDVELRVERAVATAAEANAMRGIVRRFAEEPQPEVRVEDPAMMLADRGRLVEAAAALRARIAAEPAVVAHRARLALVLLQAGLGDRARVHAERAAADDPTSNLAWIALADVCSADDYGRSYARGFDRACAIEAYRRALALTPDDAQARGSLGMILGYDRHGRWLDGDAGAAAVELRRAVEAGRDGFDAPLAHALAAAGLWQELAEVAPSLTDVALRDAAPLAAEAARQGGAALASKIAALPADRQADAAASTVALLVTGRSWRAYALFAPLATARGWWTAGGEGGELERLLAAGPRAGAGLAPEEVPIAYLESLWRQPELARRHPLLARAAAATLADDNGPVLRWRVAAAAQAPEDGFRPEAVADLLRARARARIVAGTRDVQRVELRLGAARFDAVVVRERGRWRLLTLDLEPAQLGGHALALARAGRGDAARFLLDVARGAMTGGSESFDGPPLVRAWSPGQEASRAEVRRAAAVLAAAGAEGRRALPELRRCIRGGGAAALPCLEARVPLADGEDQVALVDDLARAGAHGRIFPIMRALLLATVRPDAAERAAATLAQTDRANALVVQALAAAQRGQLGTARSTFRRALQATMHPNPRVFNLAAWLELYAAKPDWSWGLALARRAVEASDVDAAHHTLAAVQAAHGDLAEAMATLAALIDRRGQPAPADWLVYGRVAGALGEREAALAAFDRAASDPSPSAAAPYGTLELARRWRAELSP